MLPRCKLILFLEELRGSSRQKGAVGLSMVAAAALDIIRDACEESLTARDVACLADLVTEIRNEGHTGLSIYLQEDVPDCRICAALAERLRLTGR